MPNYALKSVPVLADVGVLHGDGDSPRTPSRSLERSGKSFKWLILLSLTISLLRKFLKNQSLAMLILGLPMELGMAPELPQMSWGIWKKFKMTNLTMPNNSSSMNNALKSILGLADVGVPHGDGDEPLSLAQGSGSKMCAYHVVQQGKLKGLGRSKAT